MNNLITQSFEIARANQANGRLGNRSPPQSTDNMGMELFFKKVTEIENQFDKILEQLHKLEMANNRSNYVTKASQMKEIKEQMEKDIDEVGKIALKIKTSLEELDRDNLSNRQKAGCEKGTGVDRSRLAMTMALKKKFKDRMDDFQNLRQKIQNEHREAVERRVFTVTGTRPDEETIDNLIETGNSEQIFANAIKSQGRGQILAAAAEIQERHDTVRDIENKLLNLHQMFLDLTVLVDAQGDMLDDIEAQVSKSVDHVQASTVTLQKAKKLQRNKRKYMCIAIIIFLIIIIIILIPIVKEIKKAWGNKEV